MREFDLAKLNMQFRYARSEEMLRWAVENVFPDIAMTTSFQASGIVLISMLINIQPGFPVYFIDTGYHFPETLEFRDRLINEWNLNVITIKPENESVRSLASNSVPLYKKNIELCCMVNKVKPLTDLKKKLGVSVWISAVRRDQNETRSSFTMFMLDKEGYIRLHPLIHWSRERIWEYIFSEKLPFHPLYDLGYTSIGCFPPRCTRRTYSEKEARTGRWAGTGKTECGLHLDLISEEEEAWMLQLQSEKGKNEEEKE